MTMQELRTSLKDLGFNWEPYKGGSLWRLNDSPNIYIYYSLDKEERKYYMETSISIDIVDASDVKLALNKIFENAKTFLEAYKASLSE